MVPGKPAQTPRPVPRRDAKRPAGLADDRAINRPQDHIPPIAAKPEISAEFTIPQPDTEEAPAHKIFGAPVSPETRGHFPAAGAPLDQASRH